jgi:hypothetical protein
VVCPAPALIETEGVLMTDAFTSYATPQIHSSVMDGGLVGGYMVRAAWLPVG